MDAKNPRKKDTVKKAYGEDDEIHIEPAAYYAATSKYGKMGFLGKMGLGKYFHKIKNGHFKNVQFQKNSINNRPLFF